MTLELLQEQCAKCEICELHVGRNKPVFSKGRINSNIMVCGMCPGADENKIGLPFVGKAGQILDKILLDAYGDTNVVYITNLVKCFVSPGIKLNDMWMSACLPYFIAQLRYIKPKIIITLGKDVSSFLLGNDLPMKAIRGKLFNYIGGINILSTYHPSYLIRGGGEKHKYFQTVVDDFKSVGEYV